MKCAKCPGTLRPSGDLNLDICPKCTGLWLDEGELSRIDRSMDRVSNSLDTALLRMRKVAKRKPLGIKEQVEAAAAKIPRRSKAEVSKGSSESDGLDELLEVDALELDIGYDLIKMLDPAQGGLLTERIARIRREMAVELGMTVPPIRIRDIRQLEANRYVVKLRGDSIAENENYPDMCMAMDTGSATETIDGRSTKEPAFGMDAFWIVESQKQQAESFGYLVVDAATVLTQHLKELMRQHCTELLTRENVYGLLEKLKKTHPALVEEVVPAVLKAGEIRKVLQNLLLERIPIRDLPLILETLGDVGPKTKDPEILTALVRNALARTICQQFREEDGKLYAVTLSPKLEKLIDSGIDRSKAPYTFTLSPGILRQIGDKLSEELVKGMNKGHSPVIITAPQIRFQVYHIAKTVHSEIPVLSFNEIVKDMPVEAVGMVELEN